MKFSASMIAAASMIGAAKGASLRGRNLDTQLTCGGLTMTEAEWETYWPETMSPDDWIIASTWEWNGGCNGNWDHFTAYYYQDGVEQTYKLSQDICSKHSPPLINRCAVTNGGSGFSKTDYMSSVDISSAYINTPTLTYTQEAQSTGVPVGNPIVVRMQNFRTGQAEGTASFSNAIMSESSCSNSKTTEMGESLTLKVGGPESPVSASVSDTFSVSTTSTTTQTKSDTVATGSDQTVMMDGVTCTEIIQTATIGRITYQYSGTVQSNGFYLKNSKNNDYKHMDKNRYRAGDVAGTLDSYENESVIVSYKAQDYKVVTDSEGNAQSCDWNTPIPVTTTQIVN